MAPVLEAVPNFSEGRDLDLVAELVEVIGRHGADVLDWSADPDHHRSVITFVGDPVTVERASMAAARLATEAIDLASHAGVHPRVGALDVLPFVPLHGMEMDGAVRTARRVGAALADAGIPVYFYGAASDPPGKSLAELRKGGFEGLVSGFPPGREPDLIPPEWRHPGVHPRAGATCVGARKLLLAWNVYVEGLELEEARAIAAALRERGGGFPGLRALGLALPSREAIQISMNLEDLERTSPYAVYRAIEDAVERRGGRLADTEIIGMIPDTLVLDAAADRLRILGPDPSRLLGDRVARHLAERDGPGTGDPPCGMEP